MIHFPCKVDGKYFENTRIAYREMFLQSGISYFKLQRALKAGKQQLYGHRIERVAQRLTVDLPLRPDDDGADLILQPRTRQEKLKHRQGQPLFRFPGGSLLNMGIPPVPH